MVEVVIAFNIRLKKTQLWLVKLKTEKDKIKEDCYLRQENNSTAAVHSELTFEECNVKII